MAPDRPASATYEFGELAELVPEVTDVTRPFREGLVRGELWMQRCRACGTVQHPPETFCYECGALDPEWRQASGRGEVFSFIVVHQRYHAAFAERLPYVVAIVTLDEGPRIIGPMFDIDASRVSIGMRVQPRIERVSEDGGALFFEPEQG
jgi:uncharacterized OB-fold protein